MTVRQALNVAVTATIAFLFEPYGASTRALALGALASLHSWEAFAAFVAAICLQRSILVFALYSSGMRAYGDLLRALDAPGGPTKLERLSLRELDAWSYMFLPWSKALGRHIGSDCPPVSVYLSRNVDGDFSGEVRAYPHALAGSIILLGRPHNPDSAIDLFDLYHEIGHCAKPGLLGWSRPDGMVLSTVLGLAFLVPLLSGWGFLALALAALSYLTFTVVAWRGPGRTLLLEINADAFALNRLAEIDLSHVEPALKAQIEAGEFTIHVHGKRARRPYSGEEAGRHVEVQQRVQRATENAAYLEGARSRGAKWIEVFEFPVGTLADFAFAGVCFWIGWNNALVASWQYACAVAATALVLTIYGFGRYNQILAQAREVHTRISARTA